MDKRVIGIDVGGTNLRGALVSTDGKIINRMKIASDADKGIDAVIDNLVRLIKGIGGGEEVSAVGFGIPGIIDFKAGIITQAPNICNVNNYPIRENLRARLGDAIPVIIENDANCAAVGEWWMGAGKDAGSLVMITLGTGVGGGIILDGKLWRGADGFGGEVGHMTIYPDGPRCNCGNYGCLEVYSSATGIRRMVRETLSDPDTKTALRELVRDEDPGRIPEAVMKAALEGDRAALGIWEQFGTALGIGTASLVNILNVEMIVLGGGVSLAWDMFIDRAVAELKRRALRAPAERVRVMKSVLGDDEGIIGASYLALDAGKGL
ncbi:MAG TPA: ROK family protein [Thermodesulfobacteriota bacterium]|nr:ROK family protein [Thermodesulfobacteriota bacterium]